MCHWFQRACMRTGVGVHVCLRESCAPLSRGDNYPRTPSSECNAATGSNGGSCGGTTAAKKRPKMDLIQFDIDLLEPPVATSPDLRGFQ